MSLLSKSVCSALVSPIMCTSYTLGFLDKTLVKGLLLECTRMSTFDHPNVLTLIGVCLDGGPAPYIVMPFMFNGSLLSYLKKEREKLVVTTDQKEMDTETVSLCSY